MPIMSGLHTGYEGSSTTEIHRTSVFMDVHAVHPGAAINHSGLRTVKTTFGKAHPQSNVSAPTNASRDGGITDGGKSVLSQISAGILKRFVGAVFVCEL